MITAGPDIDDDLDEDDRGPAAPAGSQRLDKWLWFARVTKSRTLASACVAEGKIKVNRVRAEKPAQLVKVGDVITSRIQRTIRVFKIIGLGVRRGPASEARLLYEDLTPRPEPKPETGLAHTEPSAWGEREAGAGRPTKRDRRQIDKFTR